VFAVDLRDMVAANRTYDRNTAIVETTLTDAKDNAVKITDFCPRFRSRGRNFRPMAIVRLLEPVKGRPIVTVRLRPLPNTAPANRSASPAAITFVSCRRLSIFVSPPTARCRRCWTKAPSCSTGRWPSFSRWTRPSKRRR
jgi:hypothetical protein